MNPSIIDLLTMTTTTNTTMNTTATQTAEAKLKRATTIATNQAVKSSARGYTLPLVLTCTVTGKSVKYTSAAYIEKCIDRAGSLEKLIATYVSREGRRQSK